MARDWRDMLTKEDIAEIKKLEGEITILKHRRYKIQNAASKRFTDAKKKAITTERKKRKPAAKRKPRVVAAEAPEAV